MITQDELKNLLYYNQSTGIFTWKVQASNVIKAGGIAGCANGRGYIHIRLKNKLYKSHRLAWLYVYGNFPKNGIDHINHKKDDNRIINLREATQKENNKNQKIRLDNTSGFVGVCYHIRDKKWQARININGKRVNLGTYSNKEDAIKARKAANIKYNFHKNHGKLKCV